MMLAGWAVLLAGAGVMLWLLRVLRTPSKHRPAIFKTETRILVVILAALLVIMGGLVLIYTAGVPVPEPGTF